MRCCCFVALVWGCSGDTGTGPTGETAGPTQVEGCPGPPMLTLGHGELDMTVVPDGGTFPFEPRGGNYFIFQVAGQVSGVGPTVQVSGGFTDAVGFVAAPIDPSFVAVAEYDAETCSGIFYGVPATLPRPPDSQTTPCIWDGVALDLRVVIDDLDGCDGESCGSAEQELGVVASGDTSGCQ